MKMNFGAKLSKVILHGETGDFTQEIKEYRTFSGACFKWDEGYRFWFIMVPDGEIDDVADAVERFFPELRVSCEV